MFSKALFKQSCKANGIMWCIITFAVCFMLACVMLISGGGNIAVIKNGVQDTIIKSEIDAAVKGRALNYYGIADKALEQFDGYFVAHYTQSGDQTAAYTAAVGDLQTYASGLAEAQGYAADSVEAQEIGGLIFYTLNPAGQYNAFYTALGEEAPVYDMSSVGTEARKEYRDEYVMNTVPIFLAGNMTKKENVDKMIDQLDEFGVTPEKYQSFGYTYAHLKHEASTVLLTYRTRYAYEISALDPAAPDYAEKLAAVQKELTGDLVGGFLATLPADVSEGLKEIGSADLYNLVVGSIFYKMAGLLLPIIYVIMVSNSLIAGQVDSGSMAYVLSTSTKRKQVTFTQALYLILSLFVMVCCTTVTSLICLAIVKSPDISLTYGKLLLMNLGAFMVLFAIGGICFLTSCVFNRSKKAMAIGGGLSMFFLVATMLGLFGSPVLPSVIRLEALNFFNYVTIISLFDVISIIEGSLSFLWKYAVLAVIGAVCYVVGSIRFKKKDLPL